MRLATREHERLFEMLGAIQRAGERGKLTRCANDLKEWDFHHFGNVRRDLRKVSDELRALGA
ncbi:hypothetical protein V2J09_009228 [Rumex salicifolius]